MRYERNDLRNAPPRRSDALLTVTLFLYAIGGIFAVTVRASSGIVAYLLGMIT
jgi:hypothetical protein